MGDQIKRLRVETNRCFCQGCFDFWNQIREISCPGREYKHVRSQG